MALKLDYLMPVGILKKTRKFIPGHLSLKKLFGEVLTWLHVAYFNDCCEEETPGTAPLRFNTATGVVEYWDNITGEWIDIAEWTETTTTTSTTSTSTTSTSSTTTSTTEAPTTTTTTTLP